MDITHIKSATGEEIRLAVWNADKASAALIFLNGLESHHGWFAGPADELAAMGIAVYALDRRGSGLNASLPASLRAWLSDIESAVRFAASERAGAPVHLAGLCLGAKLAVAFALGHPGNVRSLLLVSPGLKTKSDLRWPQKIIAGSAALRRRGPSLRSPVSDPRLFTNNPAALDFIRSDPARRTRIPAAEFLVIRRMDRTIARSGKSLAVPALAFFAEEDRIVDKEATARLLKSLDSSGDGTKVASKTYPRTSHALTFEPDIPLAEDMAEWIATYSVLGKKYSKVLILEASYETVGAAVESALDAFPRDWANKKVLVKPNVLGGTTAEQHCTTHPALVKSVVESLARRGADVIVGDNPGRLGYGLNEASFKASGILDAAPDCYKNIGLERTNVPLPRSRFLKSVSMSKAVLDADVIVSLPKFKTHQLTQISGAIKNSFGFVAGGDKPAAHRAAPTPKAFAEVLIDVYSVRPPDFVIMDAVVGMEGNGPAGKALRPDIGRIIASENAVDVDTVMAEMMGMDRSKVLLLQEAYRRGLGEPDVSGISVVGILQKIPKFKKPSTFSRLPRNQGYIFAAHRVLYGWLTGTGARLTVDRSACTSCRSCFDICPPRPKAITMKARGAAAIPEFDPKKCIRCYCCMEVCPEQAIEKRTPLGKWLFKKHF